MEGLLRQPQWRIIDQSAVGIHFQALQSFGTDDTLCASVGTGEAPATAGPGCTTIHASSAFRIPNCHFYKKAIEFLQEQGYQSIVRNSGGLAVVLDEGVLNISLIFPEAEKGIDINRGYDAMWQLIQNMFADFPHQIEAREISRFLLPRKL